jgi:hypothetical protein
MKLQNQFNGGIGVSAGAVMLKPAGIAERTGTAAYGHKDTEEKGSAPNTA